MRSPRSPPPRHCCRVANVYGPTDYGRALHDDHTPRRPPPVCFVYKPDCELDGLPWFAFQRQQNNRLFLLMNTGVQMATYVVGVFKKGTAFYSQVINYCTPYCCDNTMPIRWLEID